jgi:membrane protein
MISKIRMLINFFSTDIWRIRLKDLPGKKIFLIRYLRILVLSVKGFLEDKCQLRASALTFFTLLSIVPIAAMIFGVAKGFGFEKILQAKIASSVEGHDVVVNKIIQFAETTLQNTKGGMVAGIGLLVLFWTVISVLGNIEKSFNDIWGVKEGRPIARKLSDYLSLIMICPVLVICSSSITVFISSYFNTMVAEFPLLGNFSFIIKLSPYLVIWLLFTFVYIFMPNTRVKFKSGIIAGIIAGTLFQIFQYIYIGFQIGASKYGAIYGSFAALPLFLVWLQTSWLIVLFGAEISFAHQNVDTYEYEPDAMRISLSLKRLLTLRIVHLLVTLFKNVEKPWTEEHISHELEIPIRLVREILFELSEAGIITVVEERKHNAHSFQPAMPLERLSISNIMEMLDDKGSNDIPVAHSEQLEKLDKSLKAFRVEIAKSPANKLLKDI